jgi:hypothetical protein
MDRLVADSGHRRIVAIEVKPCDSMASGSGEPATGDVLFESFRKGKREFAEISRPGHRTMPFPMDILLLVILPPPLSEPRQSSTWNAT